MATITIDLRTKTVRPDVKIWRVFPGKNYSFLERFLADSVVFLDLPEAVLPPGRVDYSTPLLGEMVKRSVAFERYFAEMAKFAKSGDGSPPSRPPPDLSDYTTRGDFRRVGAGVTILVNLFGEARAGDLVLVPSEVGERQVHIAEFVTDPEEHETISFAGGHMDTRLSARRVRWLNHVDELRVPRAVSESLRHQFAISELSSEYLLDVLDLAYAAYSIEGGTKGARLETRAVEFNDQDNLDLGLLIKLCAKIGWDAQAERLDSDLFSTYVSDLLPDEASLHISSIIRSPGFLNVKGTTLGPMLLLALFTTALTSDAENQPDPASVHVVNTLSRADDRNAEMVEEMVRRSMSYMGQSEWAELRARSGRLAEYPKLRVPSRGARSP